MAAHLPTPTPWIFLLDAAHSDDMDKPNSAIRRCTVREERLSSRQFEGRYRTVFHGYSRWSQGRPTKNRAAAQWFHSFLPVVDKHKELVLQCP